jgi:hypothetical protein
MKIAKYFLACSTTTLIECVSLYRTLKCCNPNLGLMTKARACKGVGQEGSPRVTSHALGNVGECEGMSPHTPKWAPILGVRVQMDSQIFKERLQGSKIIKLKSFFYINGKLLERRCLKWACMTHLDIKTWVMAKRRAEGQIINLIPDH